MGKKSMLCALFVLVIFSMLALAVSGKSRFPLINKAVATVVMPVENALVAIGNTGDNIRGYWRALTVLQSENEELKRDNVELRNANVAMAAIHAENKQLRELLNYKEQHRTQTTRAAKVIARNFGDLRDSMYINIGKDAGLKREMAVLDGSGLVGIVDEVYDDYSKVLLITSARCKIGARIVRSDSRASPHSSGRANKDKQRIPLQRAKQSCGRCAGFSPPSGACSRHQLQQRNSAKENALYTERQYTLRPCTHRTLQNFKMVTCAVAVKRQTAKTPYYFHIRN